MHTNTYLGQRQNIKPGSSMKGGSSRPAAPAFVFRFSRADGSIRRPYTFAQLCFPCGKEPPGNLGIMQVQYAETIQIPRFPGFGFAAKVQNSRVAHHPVRIAQAGTGHSVSVVIPGIIVPYHILKRQNLLSIEHVEQVLIGKQHFLSMLPHIAK